MTERENGFFDSAVGGFAQNDILFTFAKINNNFAY